MYVSIRFHAPFGRVIRGLSLSNRSKVIFQQPSCFEANSGKSLTHGESSRKFFFRLAHNRVPSIVPPLYPVLIMLLHSLTPSLGFIPCSTGFRDCTGSTLLLLCFLFLLLPFSFTHTRFSFPCILFTNVFFFFLSFPSRIFQTRREGLAFHPGKNVQCKSISTVVIFVFQG